jgi:hypothetical protein
MWSRIKFYLLLGAAGWGVWLLLSYHVIFYGQEASVIQNVYFLKKSKPNLNHTFYSLHQKKPDAVLKIKDLREVGVGDLMVRLGMLTDSEKARLESQYRAR